MWICKKCGEEISGTIINTTEFEVDDLQEDLDNLYWDTDDRYPISDSCRLVLSCSKCGEVDKDDIKWVD